MPITIYTLRGARSARREGFMAPYVIFDGYPTGGEFSDATRVMPLSTRTEGQPWFALDDTTTRRAQSLVLPSLPYGFSVAPNVSMVQAARLVEQQLQVLIEVGAFELNLQHSRRAVRGTIRFVSPPLSTVRARLFIATLFDACAPNLEVAIAIREVYRLLYPTASNPARCEETPNVRAERVAVTTRQLSTGSMCGHSPDPTILLGLSNAEIPDRAFGVEMEYEVDASQPQGALCENCGGTGYRIIFCRNHDENHQHTCGYCRGSGCTQTRVSREAILQGLYRTLPQRSYVIKNDGSLSFGFEVVSAPLLKDKMFEWLDALCANLAPEAQPLATCGMHVHLSRTHFESNSHLARFYGLFHGPLRMFIERYVGATRQAQLSRWALVDSEEWRRVLHNGAICGQHYDGVSLDGAPTVEVRFFASTRDATQAKANVELLDSMVEFSRPGGRCRYPYNGEYNAFEDYLKWVLSERRKTYGVLNAYLSAHDSFSHTAKITLEEKHRLSEMAREAKRAKKRLLRELEA